MQLSPHFSLEELTHSDLAIRKGWDNTPNDQEVANLKRLANFLEAVRTIIGKPIIINSGYRSKRVNDAVGSKDSSQHRLGCAADLKVHGMSSHEIVTRIRDSGIAVDQCIDEFSAWCHISIPSYEQDRPRYQFLSIDKNGTRPFA